jgi:hypothetical protein
MDLQMMTEMLKCWDLHSGWLIMTEKRSQTRPLPECLVEHHHQRVGKCRHSLSISKSGRSQAATMCAFDH